MRRIEYTKQFIRQYKKYRKKYPLLEREVEQTLLMLENDPFDPRLKTHKLHGKLSSTLSCICGFDCRILFEIEKIDGDEVITIYKIGTHDEIY